MPGNACVLKFQQQFVLWMKLLTYLTFLSSLMRGCRWRWWCRLAVAVDLCRFASRWLPTTIMMSSCHNHCRKHFHHFFHSHFAFALFWVTFSFVSRSEKLSLPLSRNDISLFISCWVRLFFLDIALSHHHRRCRRRYFCRNWITLCSSSY